MPTVQFWKKNSEVRQSTEQGKAEYAVEQFATRLA